MPDENFLYVELLRAIHKHAQETLGENEETESADEIKFSAESLFSSMDPDTRKYEQTIRALLKNMVRGGILIGTPAEFCTTEKFSKEYAEKAADNF